MRRRRGGRAATADKPLFDVAGTLDTLGTTRAAPGWPIGLTALALAAVTAVLINSLAVTAGWLAGRLALGAIIVIVLALGFGSTALVGLASVPMLAGATIGLDRPEGHAWGQTLLIGLLWYVASELAWASIEARESTIRSKAVHQLRVREVATVVAVAVLIGIGATALASVAPVRTVVVRAIAIVAVLTCIVGVSRVLTRRADPEQAPTNGQTTS